jgi:hypothetical protein
MKRYREQGRHIFSRLRQIGNNLTFKKYWQASNFCGVLTVVSASDCLVRVTVQNQMIIGDYHG